MADKLGFATLKYDKLERHRRHYMYEVNKYITELDDPAQHVSTVSYYTELLAKLKTIKCDHETVMAHLLTHEETEDEAHATNSSTFLKKYAQLCDKVNKKIVSLECPDPENIMGTEVRNVHEISKFLRTQTKTEKEAPAVYTRKMQLLEEAAKKYNDAFAIKMTETLDQETREKFETDKERFSIHVEDLQRQLQNLLAIATRQQQTPVAPRPSEDVKLPKVFIPTFDGSEEKWIQFRDVFERTVHLNKSINDMTKFSLLLEYYKPKDHNILDGREVSAVTYQSTWQAIKDRHNDEKKLRYLYLSKLLNVKKISPLNESEVHRIHDSFDAVITNLTTLGVSWDHFLVYCVEQSLDKSSLKDWNDYYDHDDPTWSAMKAFLKQHAKNVSSINTSVQQSSKSAQPVTSSSNRGIQFDRKPSSKTFSAVATNSSSSNSSSTNFSCVACHQNHPLYKCSTFNSSSVEDRMKIVRRNNLCFNCLSRNHGIKSCSSTSRCRQCAQQGRIGNHHTLLHSDSNSASQSRSSSGPSNKIPHPTTDENAPFHRFHVTQQDQSTVPESPQPQISQMQNPQSQVLYNSYTYGHQAPPQVSQPSVQSQSLQHSMFTGHHAPTNSQSGRVQQNSLVIPPNHSNMIFNHAHAANQVQSSQNDLQDFRSRSTWYDGTLVSGNHGKHVKQVKSLNVNNPFGKVILLTTRVIMNAKDGTAYTVRCLLDTGSDTCFITKKLALSLGLKFYDDFMLVEGVMGNITELTKSVRADIHSHYGKFGATLKFMVVDDEVSSEIPSRPIDRDRMEIPNSLLLADPQFHQPQSVDILLSCDVFLFSLMNGKYFSTSGAMVIETMFGWVVGGLAPPVSRCHTHISALTFHIKQSDNLELAAKVEEFLEVENIGIVEKSNSLSPDETYCENLYTKTTHRNDTGHYVVHLLIKSCIKELESNFNKAYQRQLMLDTRRKSNPQFSLMYEKYINDMIAEGIISEVDPSKRNEGYYLPHHAVVKETSSTTKLRPVFDASCKSKTNISLNDCLYPGPTVQSELFDIFLRFRERLYGVTCDIEKMFLRFQVVEHHRKFQKILWSPVPNGKINHYQINSITFGLACAPYLATRTINQIADDNCEQFPRTSSLIKSSFYVDDGLFSFDTVEEAIAVRDELKYMFKGAHLNARKWSANDIRILNGLSPEDVETPDEKFNIKVLGHHWNITNDTISVILKEFDTTKITKALVLSIIASFYDLFGLLGPVILQAKLFMKRLTQKSLKWNDEPDEDFKMEWRNFISDVKFLGSIAVPRSMIIPRAISIELHGFSDASEEAFGCVIYIRSIDSESRIQTRIVCSKSRVAPTKKKQTLARLELCSATLLAKIANRVSNTLTIKFSKMILWNDSMITLHWIRNLPSKYHTYVANRVAAIQENSVNATWRHVPGKLNPADIVSRGLWPHELASCSQWWSPFISQPEEFWPKSQLIVVNENESSELSKEIRKTHSALSSVENFNPLLKLIETRFSRYSILLRTFVKIMRWKRLIQKRREWRQSQTERENNTQRMITRSQKQRFQTQLETPPNFPVTPDDVDDALFTIIRILQQTFFAREYKILEKYRVPEILVLPKDSKLKSLHPFFDHELKLIRVGGRIEECEFISFDHKHPFVIPECHFSNILVAHMHRDHHHPTKLALESFVKQRFWPLNLLNTIKKITRQCKNCFRYLAKPKNQLMSSLPKARVNLTTAFDKTCVDFAGPFHLRASLTKRSSIVKCYVAMFKCMTTGAIHLELVTSLNTPSFIMAFDRFVARRNLPREMYSDNGGSFHAADTEFRQTFREIIDDLAEYFTYKGIRWIFTTPLAPHAGGVYEIGVKIFKHYLLRSIGNHSYDFELFSTLLSKIEADINSRPLLAMSSNPNDMEILTPAHFLVFKELNARPERNLIPVKENLLTAINRVHKTRQHFWQEWLNHYLHTLQTRPKGFQNISEYKENQLVLIVDKNISPRKWRTARIIKLFPGRDNVVRNVRLRTQTGELDRHVKYIVPLPTLEQESPPAGTVLLNANIF